MGTRTEGPYVFDDGRTITVEHTDDRGSVKPTALQRPIHHDGDGRFMLHLLRGRAG